MKKLRRLFILLILVGSTYAGWNYRDLLIEFYHQKIANNISPKEAPKPDPKRYQKLISELAEKRLNLSDKYSRARTAREISDVVSESQQTLEQILPAMMSCWLGTPWDFNGICQTPGSGKIACGYFVSTILRDAGFSVERVRLAQQPSQWIIGTFLSKKMMTIRAGQNYDTFVDQAIERGPGIHIVGLDNHVAFVVIPESGGIRFIHSSGAHPFCVVDEDRSEAVSLQRSNYRVIGNLTRSPEVIHGWLVGQKWPTKISSGK